MLEQLYYTFEGFCQCLVQGYLNLEALVSNFTKSLPWL